MQNNSQANPHISAETHQRQNTLTLTLPTNLTALKQQHKSRTHHHTPRAQHPGTTHITSAALSLNPAANLLIPAIYPIYPIYPT